MRTVDVGRADRNCPRDVELVLQGVDVADVARQADGVRRAWPRTAALAGGFCGLGKRNLMAWTPAAALCIVALLGTSPWQGAAPGPGRAPGQVLELTTPSGEVRAPAGPGRVVRSRPVAPRAEPRPPAARERRAPRVQVGVAESEPAGAGAAVAEQAAGSGEQTPVEVVEACVEQLQVSVEHVGC